MRKKTKSVIEPVLIRKRVSRRRLPLFVGAVLCPDAKHPNKPLNTTARVTSGGKNNERDDIQEVLERRQGCCERPVKIVGSGRTDAGCTCN